MAALKTVILSLALLKLAAHVTGSCDDIDTTACQRMQHQSPDLCQNNMAVAESACPRFCGMCPLNCYHCDATARSASDCVTTKICATGEKCLIATMRSYTDGHVEYKMNCATANQCDGIDYLNIMGRRHAGAVRSLSMECCTQDMCNIPANFLTTTVKTTTSPTTTTPKPTTATTKPTTPIPTTTSNKICIRDIEILVEDVGQSSRDTATLKDFLHHLLISTLDVSDVANMVGLATFDRSVHAIDQLQSNKDQLQHDIDSLRFHYPGHFITLADVSSFLQSRKHDLPGGRRDVNNVIIFLFDTRAHMFGVGGAPNLDNISHDVIVIIIGAIHSHGFEAIATDSNHLLQVDDYHSLTDIETQLLDLLCM